MPWISLQLCCLVLLSGALGTPPGGGGDNFYSYRMDYDDDLDYANNGLSGYERKGQGRDYYDDEETTDGRYRGSDDWIGGNRRGWGVSSSSFSFNRIPQRPNRPQQLIPQKAISSGGWDEEEAQVPWSPPRRRKPSYVVKIRRPVKKDPAWIYFRPPNPGRVAPGWSRPSQPAQPVLPPPPIRRPPPINKVASSWEEDSTAGSYPKDASYSFAYDAGDSERSEYSDPWGTVRGSYSYIDPTGTRRTVHYTAGAATGFKILNSQPTNLVENVYRERDPVVVRRKPSAYVYHLHPDGGWKPWEGRKEVTRDEHKARTSNTLAAEDQPEEELALDETRYDPQPPDRKRLEEPQRQAQRRYEPLQSRDEEERKIEVRGYEGGYGDRNPLVVLEDKKISPGKMMAMRMRRKKTDQEEQPQRHPPPPPHQQRQRQMTNQHPRKSLTNH